VNHRVGSRLPEQSMIQSINSRICPIRCFNEPPKFGVNTKTSLRHLTNDSMTSSPISNNRSRPALLLIALMIMSIGSFSAQSEGDDGCDANSDCPDGQICSDGTCMDSSGGDAGVNLESPTGGEVYMVGNVETIQWITFGTANEVDIYYRVAGGDWSVISEGVENGADETGYYDWVVPNDLNQEVQVKVIAATESGEEVFDTSEFFSIVEEEDMDTLVQIMSPNDVADYTIGQPVLIYWGATNTDAVNIYHGPSSGGPWTVIVDNLSTTYDGATVDSYLWSAAADEDIFSGEEVWIKIDAVVDPEIYDISDAPITFWQTKNCPGSDPGTKQPTFIWTQPSLVEDDWNWATRSGWLDLQQGIHVCDDETGEWVELEDTRPTSVEIECDEEPTEEQLDASNLADLLNEYGEILIRDGDDTIIMSVEGLPHLSDEDVFDATVNVADNNNSDSGNVSTKGGGISKAHYFKYGLGVPDGGDGMDRRFVLQFTFESDCVSNVSTPVCTERFFGTERLTVSVGVESEGCTLIGYCGLTVSVGVEYIHDDGLLWLATGVYNDGDGIEMAAGVGNGGINTPCTDIDECATNNGYYDNGSGEPSDSITVVGGLDMTYSDGMEPGEYIFLSFSTCGNEPQESDVCDDFYYGLMYSGIGGDTGDFDFSFSYISPTTLSDGNDGDCNDILLWGPASDVEYALIVALIAAVCIADGGDTGDSLDFYTFYCSTGITPSAGGDSESWFEDLDDEEIVVSAGVVELTEKEVAVAGGAAAGGAAAMGLAGRGIRRATEGLINLKLKK